MNEIFSGAKFCTEIGGRQVLVSGADIRNALRYYHEHEESLTEGKWISVDPGQICKELFSTPREIKEEENLRKKIKAALAIAEGEKAYQRKFYYMVPPKPEKQPFNQIIANAKKNHIVIMDWVRQALVWAFRLTHGESWENICTKSDPSSWFKIIKGRDTYELWGGSRELCAHIPETMCIAIVENDKVCTQGVPVYVRVEK